MKRMKMITATALSVLALGGVMMLGTWSQAHASTSVVTEEKPILHSPVMAAEQVNAEDFTAYKWRNDIKNTDALPINFRTMLSDFGEADAKYGLDENYEVSHEGLDTLRMSGSGEYTEEQFHNMVTELERVADRDQIYVIDMRQECHIYADGNSVCWWGERDWSNLGKDAEEIEAEEAKLAAETIGKTIMVVPQDDTEDGSGTMELHVTETKTERELVEQEGLHYYRFPCTDHIWPEAEEIDAFMELVKTLPDDAWLHIHCVAGKGRTGAFMCIYDLMKNPEVSLKDITYRQHLLGANYLLSTGNSSWTGPYKAEITTMLTTFYVYAQECGPNGYQTTWSEWLQTR